MAKGRDAIDTITGYYYQFDYSILQLLDLENENNTITIEGIEDVDISEEAGLTAIQCKYYDKTEYNHSVIAKPIHTERFSPTYLLLSLVALCNFPHKYQHLACLKNRLCLYHLEIILHEEYDELYFQYM